MGDESDTVNKKEDSLEWTDNACLEIASKDVFPLLVKDLSVQKRVISRFLDFYLGKRDKGIGIDDLAFAVLAIMPNSPYNENLVWHPKQFNVDGTLFFLNPEDKLMADVKKLIDKSIEEEKYDTEEEKTEDNTEYKSDMELDENDTYLEQKLFSKTVLEMMKNSASFLLDDFEPKGCETNNIDELANVPNENIGQADSKDSNPWDIFPKEIKFYPKPIEQQNISLNYGPVENAAFVTYCNTVLNDWETENNKSERTVLKSFFAVVALVLMRATSKGYKHLDTTFRSEKFLRFLRHVLKVSPRFKYSPPHKRCLKGAFRTFCRKDKNTPIMFAKLVLLCEAVKDKYLKYTIKNGLLNYTADYGLNLVMLWQSIHSAVAVKEDVRRIVELTSRDETRSSWERLTKFLVNYKTPTCKEVTYRWARILDPRYFKELSCQANYVLAVLLAVFAEKIAGNTGVWNATWVKNNDEEETLKQLGGQLYDQYASKEMDNKTLS